MARALYGHGSAGESRRRAGWEGDPRDLQIARQRREAGYLEGYLKRLGLTEDDIQAIKDPPPEPPTVERQTETMPDVARYAGESLVEASMVAEAEPYESRVLVSAGASGPEA